MSLAVFLFAAIYPLFLQKPRRYFADSPQLDFDDSLSVLETIAELEADFQSGKLSQKDFEALAVESKREYLHLRRGGIL